MAGRAGEARDRRVIHRRALVRDDEGIEVRRRVTALAGRGPEWNVRHRRCDGRRRTAKERPRAWQAAQATPDTDPWFIDAVVFAIWKVVKSSANDSSRRPRCRPARDSPAAPSRSARHVREALARAVADRAGGARDLRMVHRVLREVRRVLWQVWQLDEAPFAAGCGSPGSCPRRQSSA